MNSTPHFPRLQESRWLPASADAAAGKRRGDCPFALRKEKWSISVTAGAAATLTRCCYASKGASCDSAARRYTSGVATADRGTRVHDGHDRSADCPNAWEGGSRARPGSRHCAIRQKRHHRTGRGLVVRSATGWSDSRIPRRLR